MNTPFSFKLGRFFAVVAVFALLAVSCGRKKPEPQPPVQPKPLTIESVSVDQSYVDGDYTMFSDGAAVVAVVPDAQSVEVKYIAQDKPDTEQTLGLAISLSSRQNTWMLPLPKDFWATSLWVEAQSGSGQFVKSQSLGNVRYENVNTYESPDAYGFSFHYFGNFGFSTEIEQVKILSYMPACSEDMVACAFLKREAYAGTNFEAAGVSINLLKKLNTETKCYNFAVSTNEAQTVGEDASINEVVFKTATGGGGAAGHFDTMKVYRNFHNGMCYEIARTIVATNIANYEPNTIKQFDQGEVERRLESVVQTFEFVK